jgi:hypothetical protein
MIMSNILKLKRICLDIDEFGNKSDLNSKKDFFSQYTQHGTFALSDSTEYEYYALTQFSINKVENGEYQYQDSEYDI